MQLCLFVAVVADELEERAVAIALDEGVSGVSVVSAHGLGFPEHMTFFGITYKGLEKVIISLMDRKRAEHLAERMNRELELLKPFQGLAFCLDVDAAAGVAPDASGADGDAAG